MGQAALPIPGLPGLQEVEDPSVQVPVVTLLAANTICATATWVALVADGISLTRFTPRAFWRALRNDVELFGVGRVLLWAVLCFFAWWLIWIAWIAEDWLEPRR